MTRFSDAKFNFIGLNDRFTDGKMTWLNGTTYNSTNGVFQWRNQVDKENADNVLNQPDCTVVESNINRMSNVLCYDHDTEYTVRGVCEIKRRESEHKVSTGINF